MGITLSDAITLSAGESKPRRKGDKHYVPFNREEWERVRKAFNRPDMMPEQLKKVILAMCNGTFNLEAVKPAVAGTHK